VYSIWDGVDTTKALEKLTQDFVDQTAFIQYFTSTWLPKIGKGLNFSPSHPYYIEPLGTPQSSSHVLGLSASYLLQLLQECGFQL